MRAMIVSFADSGTEDLFNRTPSLAARRVCPMTCWPAARRKLDQLNAAVSLGSLRLPSGNRLEALRGDRSGWYSIRVNDQWRVCFRWTVLGPADVAVVDYH
jgi:proteic killer suppression protein